MKILQVVPDLRSGGAELVAVNLANYWQDSGHQCYIAALRLIGPLIDLANDDVGLIDLKCGRLRNSLFKVREAITRLRPDIIVAHMWPLTSVVFLSWIISGGRGKLFLCEHICISKHIRYDLHLSPWPVRLCIFISHNFATGVIGVSTGVSDELKRFGGIANEKVYTVFNPVVRSVKSSPHDATNFNPVGNYWRRDSSVKLISVGTLKAQKNHRLLIEAFSNVVKRTGNIELLIVGEGPERGKLELLIQNLGLEKLVTLPGFLGDPSKLIGEADVFVLSSDYEGFGIVIVESLSEGTPVVSTDCDFGPSEILDGGKFGLLCSCNDSEEMADKILIALSMKWDKNFLMDRAKQFSIECQSRRYLELFGLAEPD